MRESAYCSSLAIVLAVGSVFADDPDRYGVLLASMLFFMTARICRAIEKNGKNL